MQPEQYMIKPQSFKHDRPTIGVLAGRSTLEGTAPDPYRISVIRGIQAAARDRECHLLISWGIRTFTETNLLHSVWPVVSPESDFVPVGPWNTDGLILFAPLANESQSLYLKQLAAEGFPVLFIAAGEKGTKVSVNNGMGIDQAMAHLAQHGHRRIAFLAGMPTDYGDSKIRLDAYYSSVTKYNLEADRELVVWGWHDFAEGYKSMRELLHGSIKFTAVLASNDNSAIGAMKAIGDAGLKIPQNIAIIGFDDQPGAIAQVPPLTSVHVPLNKIGQQALFLMADHLLKQSPLESVQILPRLIQRQSCGCMPDMVSSALIRTSSKKTAAHRSIRSDVQAPQQELVSELLKVLPPELQPQAREQIRKTYTDLVESFYISLKQENHNRFEKVFIETVQKLEIADAATDHLHELISFLRREMIPLPVFWRQNKIRQLADDMLLRARAIIGESILRQDKRHEYQRSMNARALNLVTARLSVALSNDQVVELLNTYLPEIGIRHARLMFFESEQEDSVAWSVVPSPLKDAPNEWRFRSREFPPLGLYEQNELLNLILLPLIFQSEVLGYVAFDASDIESCAVIAKQLTATIKVARLHAQVVELSLTDTLTGLHNRRYFDLFLTNEILRGNRFSHKLSIIMVDIDRFKDYNDQFGHIAGDQALQLVANCLTNERRATDVVTRIGGEEFAIILPEIDIKGALVCAEKLRVSVAAIPDLKCPITISLGIAMLSEDIYTSESLLQHVDQALYEAKKTGRNKVCIYQGK
jgi:diguanylate cyclase (GGDEF)-like protein